MKKKILILNTGGTISSVKTIAGYQPARGHVTKALRAIPAFSHADMPDYEVHEYEPLLDSSNLTCDDWNRIAGDIKKHYDTFDGFVIFHGTDTLAYTASALSFMLENLNKPVILTGSQIPLAEVRNDAVDNALTSIWLCTHAPIHEVCVYFNQHLLRGNRTQKVSSTRFDAFDSPNFPHLGEVGTTINLANGLLLPEPTLPFRCQALRTAAIANFRLWPGISFDLLEALLNMPVEALVLETYGAGNAPNQSKRFLSLLEAASKRGIILVNKSQCVHGKVQMTQYATGHALKERGLLSGYDMTPEAIYCKLLYLFSKYDDADEIKRAMSQSLVGELSQ
ncbi:MAG: asparaginase [Legionellaceae bacterium]|nr:asparaginase [Legionellaceae bacterium]